jgi:hypothetical protein
LASQFPINFLNGSPVAGQGYDRTVAGPHPSIPNAGQAPDVSAAIGLLRSFAGTGAAEPDAADADVLAAPERAVPWLRAQGLMPDGATLTGSEHRALLRLRDALRDALSAHPSSKRADDQRADAEIAARLTTALADGRLVVTITEAGAVQLATAARAVYPSIVAAIAVAIAEADAAGVWLNLT